MHTSHGPPSLDLPPCLHSSWLLLTVLIQGRRTSHCPLLNRDSPAPPLPYQLLLLSQFFLDESQLSLIHLAGQEPPDPCGRHRGWVCIHLRQQLEPWLHCLVSDLLLQLPRMVTQGAFQKHLLPATPDQLFLNLWETRFAHCFQCDLEPQKAISMGINSGHVGWSCRKSVLRNQQAQEPCSQQFRGNS